MRFGISRRPSFLLLLSALVATFAGAPPSGFAAMHHRHRGHPVALQRIFNNPGPGATRPQAFWTIGYPFADGEIPPGHTISGCRLGGKWVPCSLVARKLHADGSVAWGQLLVDFSRAPIPAGGSAALSLMVAPGNWKTTTSRRNSDWEALGDRVTLSGLTTSGAVGPDTTGNGVWVADFDGGSTNTIEIYGRSPQGLFVEVTAQFTSAGVTHRNLTAVMDYWVTEHAFGGGGPVESWGPFIRNTLLHPSDPTISTLAAFLYDAAFTRGNSTIRSYNGVVTPALAIGNMMRPDAQGDWTAADPGIFVTQNYSDVVATQKVPPFAPGVTYTGSSSPQPHANVTDIAGSVITVDDQRNIFGNPNADNNGWYPQSVEFGAVVFPGGIEASTIYWAVHEGPQTISVYDTLVDALANGTTGLVTPTSAGSGVTIEIAEAPGATGQYDLAVSDAGSRPDLSLTTEWGAAYLVGNTQDWQRLGRVMAYDAASNPIFGIDGATGRIVSLMDSGNTPSGMASYPSDYYGAGLAYSPDINAGKVPSGGVGGWSYGGSGLQHTPNGVYIAWLMEGGPFLRDLLVGIGNSTLALSAYITARNIVIAGTTYYGTITCLANGDAARKGAWRVRDVAEAAMAAGQGTVEEAYFRNVLAANMSECAAYESYKGKNFQGLGFVFADENLGTNPLSSNPIGTQEVEGFMQSYMAAALAWAALLEGDYVGGLSTQASFASQWLEHFYGSGGCPYYATAYTFGPGFSVWGDASPGTYVASFSELGTNGGAGAVANFAGGSTTVTMQTRLPWTLAPGDVIRLTNYDTGGNQFQSEPAPPPPFVTGTDYYIENPNQSTGTFQLSSTNGGAPIIAGATVNGVNGFFVPAGQTTCPPGVIGGSTTMPDSYLMYQVSALAIMDELGVSGAATAYTNASGLFAGSCSTAMHWCMAPP